MAEWIITIDGANLPALDGELKAVAAIVRGVSLATLRSGEQVLTIHLEREPDEAETLAIGAALDAHDPAQLTPEQVAEARAAATADVVQGIPGWATWSAAEVVAWLDANVQADAGTKTAIKAMAQMMVAVRDKTWPHLAG